METSYDNKPYYFVPLIAKADRRDAMSKQMLLTPNYRAGKLNISIECMTPLHIGSGQVIYEKSTESFCHALFRENDKITLPGSSFKGMLRSVFEAVTLSCVLLSPRALPSKVGLLSACNTNSGVCPACSVFGSLSNKGKLIFSPFCTTDAKSIKYKIPLLEQPFRAYPIERNKKFNLRTGNERLYYGEFRDIRGLDVARLSKTEFFHKKDREQRSGGNFYGRKFYKHSNNWEILSNYAGVESYECIPPRSILHGSIIYQGLTNEELGALLFSLGLGWSPPIYHKLGYAKSAFMGSVKLDVDVEALPRYDTTQMTKDDAVESAIRHYKKNEQSIKSAVHALQQEWANIGDSMWVKQDGKYGY